MSRTPAPFRVKATELDAHVHRTVLSRRRSDLRQMCLVRPSSDPLPCITMDVRLTDDERQLLRGMLRATTIAAGTAIAIESLCTSIPR